MNRAATDAGPVGARFIAPDRIAFVLVALLAFSLQVWPLVQAGRYPLAAYNPLVGGVRAAEHAIPIGWGDGLDVAGDDIRQLAGGRLASLAGRWRHGCCPGRLSD